MATYLLTWNPKKSVWGDFPDALRAIRNGQIYKGDWSCGNTKRIRKGDRLFMMRQGSDDPGLMASGHALGKPYLAPHWSDPAKTALYVDVDFDFVSKRSMLPRAELRAAPFDTVNWGAQSSGISINPSVAGKLESVWSARTGVGQAGSGKQDGADDFRKGRLDETALQHILDLDATYQARGRKEQSKIRSQLLGSAKIGNCAFCQQAFPVDLLVAAHIKRRADCSDREKRDFKNNVIVLCKFGCDDLFERGYLVVNNGKLDSGRPSPTSPVTTRVSFMRGKSVLCGGDRSARYFVAHYERAIESEVD